MRDNDPFGTQLRRYRQRCADSNGQLLTQELLGEEIERRIGVSYTGAAVSKWERGRSQIHQDDRLVLVCLIELLHEWGGLQSLAEANALLEAGNYRALNDEEIQRLKFALPTTTTSPRLGESSPTTRFFISYKQHLAPDHNLADTLHQALQTQGHDVFIDRSLRRGVAWLQEIDQQLQQADYLLVLLSPDAADSEMVQAEVRRAYGYKRQNGRPAIIPIRIAYEGMLPYSIAAYLDGLHYILWRDEADNERVLQEILTAVTTPSPTASLPTFAAPTHLSEDGRYLSNGHTIAPPLPEFDPRFLAELPAPGGTVRLRDKFYIEREADQHLKRQIIRPGSITTIRAPRQTGKSSLLVRGIFHARQMGATTISLDLQRVDREYLQSLDSFLRYLAEIITLELGLDTAVLDQAWQRSLGPRDKITYYLARTLLAQSGSLLILAMDEVDLLLETGFHTDFFGLIRSWHNNAAYDPTWEKLGLLLSISTEPYLLISDVHQSPFNIGLKLYLQDFDAAQVQELNHRHNSPVSQEQFAELMALLNGHPYLTRKALYTLVMERPSWHEFSHLAATDIGPFADHLRHQLWLLRDEPTLVAALKEVMTHQTCHDEMARFRLLRAGLINATGDVCTCRCDLYQRYFVDKL